MAKKAELPSYKEKQQMLFGKNVDRAQLVQTAKMLLEAGWLSDAIDFFGKAEDSESLESVRRMAISEGDLFLFRKVLKTLGEDSAPAEQWRELADMAKELGKLEFAREGYRMAGDRKKMDEIDRLMNPPESDEVVDAGYEGEP
ncbi:MAG: hypothetical protein D6806_16750 [Deltaproteobacteria bacterium]|nr:MAG: hypothetical protein D6806_16750 [Deltaproteobacteria bacterium]